MGAQPSGGHGGAPPVIARRTIASMRFQCFLLRSLPLFSHVLWLAPTRGWGAGSSHLEMDVAHTAHWLTGPRNRSLRHIEYPEYHIESTVVRIDISYLIHDRSSVSRSDIGGWGYSSGRIKNGSTQSQIPCSTDDGHKRTHDLQRPVGPLGDTTPQPTPAAQRPLAHQPYSLTYCSH